MDIHFQGYSLAIILSQINGEWFTIVLSDLVSLGQIWVEVVLAIKGRDGIDMRVQCKGSLDRQIHALLAQLLRQSINN
jgi:hypothetical protein